VRVDYGDESERQPPVRSLKLDAMQTGRLPSPRYPNGSPMIRRDAIPPERVSDPVQYPPNKALQRTPTGVHFRCRAFRNGFHRVVFVAGPLTSALAELAHDAVPRSFAVRDTVAGFYFVADESIDAGLGVVLFVLFFRPVVLSLP